MPKRVLIIDDNIPLANLITEYFSLYGHHPYVQTNAYQALAQLNHKNNEFDLVIMDQTMPGINGIDLAVTALKSNPDLPIVLCTGYSDFVNKETAQKLGIKYFFQKPVDLDKLIQIAEEI